MLVEWIQAARPDRPLIVGPPGTVTYADVAAVAGENGDGQVVVEPEPSLDSLVRLLTVPAGGRQLVLVDPGLPTGERRRRVEAATVAARRDAMTVLFTSGTTGPAKAVRLTAANWEAAAAASAAHLGHEAEDVWLAAMPLHHVGGLSILYRTVQAGATMRWLPRFEVEPVVAALRGDVTIASVVPTMLRRILDHDARPYHGLKAVLVGGGPIPTGLLEEAHDRGIPALPTYGMTETCAQVATLRPGSPPRRAAHPLPGVEVRIGTDDRIELRGAQISPGYADEDDRAPGEWFTTPDRGELHPDGALTVLGRADDVVVTGGENVYPGEVEAVLLSHPGVEAAAVTGVPDPEWGAKLVAGYQGSVTEPELLKWLSERLARYQVPRVVRRFDELPMTGGGKPDRAAIARAVVAD